eukprot:gene2248-2422_t
MSVETDSLKEDKKIENNLSSVRLKITQFEQLKKSVGNESATITKTTSPQPVQEKTRQTKRKSKNFEKETANRIRSNSLVSKEEKILHNIFPITEKTLSDGNMKANQFELHERKHNKQRKSTNDTVITKTLVDKETKKKQETKEIKKEKGEKLKQPIEDVKVIVSPHSTNSDVSIKDEQLANASTEDLISHAANQMEKKLSRSKFETKKKTILDPTEESSDPNTQQFVFKTKYSSGNVLLEGDKMEDYLLSPELSFSSQSPNTSNGTPKLKKKLIDPSPRQRKSLGREQEKVSFSQEQMKKLSKKKQNDDDIFGDYLDSPKSRFNSYESLPNYQNYSKEKIVEFTNSFNQSFIQTFPNTFKDSLKSNLSKDATFEDVVDFSDVFAHSFASSFTHSFNSAFQYHLKKSLNPKIENEVLLRNPSTKLWKHLEYDLNGVPFTEVTTSEKFKKKRSKSLDRKEEEKEEEQEPIPVDDESHIEKEFQKFHSKKKKKSKPKFFESKTSEILFSEGQKETDNHSSSPTEDKNSMISPKSNSTGTPRSGRSRDISTPTKVDDRKKSFNLNLGISQIFKKNKTGDTPRMDSLSEVLISTIIETYTLDFILENDHLKEYFLKYSDRIYCSENIHFYDDVLAFKQETNQERKQDLADIIIDKYLLSKSDEEINVRQEEIAYVIEHKNDCPSNLFDTLFQDIFDLIRTENYHKFIYNSQEFKDLLKEYENIKYIDGKYYQKPY